MKTSSKDEMIAALSVDRNRLHQENERLRRMLRLALRRCERLSACFDAQRGLAAVAFEGWQNEVAERQILEAENERLRIELRTPVDADFEVDHESC